MSDLVFIEANGERITEWTQYAVDSDLLTPADGFSFEVAIPKEDARRRDELRAVLSLGTEVKIYVGDDVGDGSPRDRFLQMVGVIDDRHINVTKENGTIFAIEGRDLAGTIVQASVALDVDVRSDMRLVDLVRAAVDPYDILVVTDSFAGQRQLRTGRQNSNENARRAGVPSRDYSLTAQAEADRTGRPVDEVTGNFLSNAISAIQARRAARTGYANVMGPADIGRLTVRDARPQAGETVWAFCARHAERLGVLLWFSPQGRLVLSSPQYSQEPLFRAVRRYVSDPADPNNVASGSLSESIGDRHSGVTVYGRGNVRSSARQPVVGTATDDSWPSGATLKPLIAQDTSLRTSAACARKALRTLMEGKKNAFEMTYQLHDHGQGRYLFAIDRTIAVVDEPVDVDGTFYITKRTFRGGRDTGTVTDIRVVPRGSLVF